uniref:CBS domain-containing protein n=1 Tax=Zooxanthella nutricula TaxID=1333877 RepID=A0A7S2KCJ5_9DINO
MKACATRANAVHLVGQDTPGGGILRPAQDRSDCADPEGVCERLIPDTIMLSSGGLPSQEKLPVGRLVDPVPYTILEEMPAARLYPLFAKAGVNVACVVSETGKFRGMISRKGLIEVAKKLDEG